MSRVLGGLLIPDEKRCVSSVNTSMNGNLAVAIFSSDDMFVSGNRSKKEVDISHFYISLAHAHLGVLKATAQQHGIRLVVILVPCLGCSQAKEIHAATAHHTATRA